MAAASTVVTAVACPFPHIGPSLFQLLGIGAGTD
jgi:hypothetical protein